MWFWFANQSNFQWLEVVDRCRDPQLQATKNWNSTVRISEGSPPSSPRIFIQLIKIQFDRDRLIGPQNQIKDLPLFSLARYIHPGACMDTPHSPLSSRPFNGLPLPSPAAAAAVSRWVRERTPARLAQAWTPTSERAGPAAGPGGGRLWVFCVFARVCRYPDRVSGDGNYRVRDSKPRNIRGRRFKCQSAVDREICRPHLYPNAVSMLGCRLRRQPNIEPTIGWSPTKPLITQVGLHLLIFIHLISD